MKVLIAGGTGFLGSALADRLVGAGHTVQILTRRSPQGSNEIQWDGRTVGAWASRLEDVDAVVNTTGYGLEHWPWTQRQKKRFLDSRVLPAKALTSAIEASRRRPRTFVQVSGINYYGLRGEPAAEESTPAASDFLAQLAVEWEAATQPLDALGVRRAVARTAVVLAPRGGLFPLMALPVRLMAGGRFGDGKQVVPWIHVDDQLGALQFLLESEEARGPFNVIAPEATSNAEFMRAVASALRRPYWFPTPAFVLRMVLGEMSVLILEGRASVPHRLQELGFEFKYPALKDALSAIFQRSKMPT